MDELIVPAVIAVILLALGLIGRFREKSHLRKLDQREREFNDMLVTQIKSFPEAVPGEGPPCLLVAETVIATDYLKSFLAGIRNIFGGEVKSYQTLLTRARRESTLRILEEAQRLGYNAVCNLRLNTADVGGSAVMQRVPTVAILAAGTAYHASPRPK